MTAIVASRAGRLWHVAATGTFTLDGLTMRGGVSFESELGGGSGGGLFNRGGTVLIRNSVLTNNLAQFLGGGIDNWEGTVTLQNTILACNLVGVSPSDCWGPVTSMGHNLIGDPTSCDIILHATDLTGDPGLDGFTDDGAPGHGHVPLLATSQAIDAADDAVCPDTNQLGQPRVGSCDIGAIELQYHVLPVTIDIKPGLGVNTVHLKSNGVIPVAILTTERVDATTIDPLSVRFGPGGGRETHHIGHFEDVNQDRKPDLVLHFRTQDTGLPCGATAASLTGKTVNGDPIQGSDVIKTRGCEVQVVAQ